MLSIVIPTTVRANSLSVAVDSALRCAESLGQSVDVIVVPNGSGRNWATALAPFEGNSSLRVSPLPLANANAARNHGLELATEKFVRFLDDDDRLYPNAVAHQVKLLERSGADICSSAVDLSDDDGNIFDTSFQPDTPDFISGCLSPTRFVQCTAHLFRRDVICDTRWDHDLAHGQDVDWFLRLGLDRDLMWVKTGERVGAWNRSTTDRMSTASKLGNRKKIVARAILRLTDALRQSGRLTMERREAAADGLWECVKSALFLDPHYWIRVAQAATSISPGSCPPSRIHHSALRKLGIAPVGVEFALIPKRYASYFYRRAALRLGLLRHW